MTLYTLIVKKTVVVTGLTPELGATLLLAMRAIDPHAQLVREGR